MIVWKRLGLNMRALTDSDQPIRPVPPAILKAVFNMDGFYRYIKVGLALDFFCVFAFPALYYTVLNPLHQ